MISQPFDWIIVNIIVTATEDLFCIGNNIIEIKLPYAASDLATDHCLCGANNLRDSRLIFPNGRYVIIKCEKQMHMVRHNHIVFKNNTVIHRFDVPDISFCYPPPRLQANLNRIQITVVYDF